DGFPFAHGIAPAGAAALGEHGRHLYYSNPAGRVPVLQLADGIDVGSAVTSGGDGRTPLFLACWEGRLFVVSGAAEGGDTSGGAGGSAVGLLTPAAAGRGGRPGLLPLGAARPGRAVAGRPPSGAAPGRALPIAAP